MVPLSHHEVSSAERGIKGVHPEVFSLKGEVNKKASQKLARKRELEYILTSTYRSQG